MLAVALVVIGLLAASGGLHQSLLDLIARVEPWIHLHPVLGAILFMVLAALSAMVVFVSSVLLVPVGVATWGVAGCLVLLWTGWFFGGLLTYLVGRHFGRQVVERMVSPEKLAEYERRMPQSRSFWTALFVQLALQSDVAGYLFGLLRFPLATYLGALMTAELIFAIGTVFVGEAFLRGQWVFLLGFAALAGVALLWRHIHPAPSVQSEGSGPST